MGAAGVHNQQVRNFGSISTHVYDSPHSIPTCNGYLHIMDTLLLPAVSPKNIPEEDADWLQYLPNDFDVRWRSLLVHNPRAGVLLAWCASRWRENLKCTTVDECIQNHRSHVSLIGCPAWCQCPKLPVPWTSWHLWPPHSMHCSTPHPRGAPSSCLTLHPPPPLPIHQMVCLGCLYAFLHTGKHID